VFKHQHTKFKCMHFSSYEVFHSRTTQWFICDRRLDLIPIFNTVNSFSDSLMCLLVLMCGSHRAVPCPLLAMNGLHMGTWKGPGAARAVGAATFLPPLLAPVGCTTVALSTCAVLC
jgi:hypothetical protein